MKGQRSNPRLLRWPRVRSELFLLTFLSSFCPFYLLLLLFLSSLQSSCSLDLSLLPSWGQLE